jgi:hypothetical protein
VEHQRRIGSRKVALLEAEPIGKAPTQRIDE